MTGAHSTILHRLCRLFDEVCGRSIAPDRGLAEQGLDSVALLNVLVAIEDAFGIEWDDDVPEPALSSISAMAQHISSELEVYG